MTKSRIKSQRGFTLIELMVVVAIIAILSTIGIGGFSNAQKKSRDARRRADVKTIQSTMISASDTNGNMDALSAVAEAGGKFPDDPGKNMRYMLYAPTSDNTDPALAKIKGNSDNIVYIESTEGNSGVVCATLEIPKTGNANDLRADIKAEEGKASSQLPFEDSQFTGGVTDVVDLEPLNGSISIVPCGNIAAGTGGGCNLFCATF